MPVDLRSPGPQLLASVTRDLAAKGMAAVRDVRLPGCFEPAMTDVVFLAVDGNLEIYISAVNTYRGGTPAWLEIMARPPAPGGARLAIVCPPGPEAALGTFKELLDSASGLMRGHRPGPQALSDIDEALAAVRPSLRSPVPEAEAVFECLAARVRGQDDALRLLSRLACRHLARQRHRRPATAFALGPTGVGKTLAAESLPVALQEASQGGSEYAFVRLDMNEYSESFRVSQLLGAPQGYVGHDYGAQLVNTLKAHPKAIVLFDEIDKAHADVQYTLMNAMDAGRLSTAKASNGGWEVDCREAIFLFTAHCDTAEILAEVQRRGANGRERATDDVCRAHLRATGIRPEFIGRIGAFLVFQNLSERTRAEIIALSVSRIAEEYGLTVERVAPTVIAHLLTLSDGAGFGARPDEFLVDEILGECFAIAADHLKGTPLAIAGPPFTCAVIG
jgi:AAA domain (Cdc48 subfamily)